MAGIVVRAGLRDDVPALTDVYNHYVATTASTFDVETFTADERLQWFGHYAESGPYRLLVAEDETGLLGYATSSRFRAKRAYDTSVETTLYLAPEVTGRGVGSHLYTTLFDVLVDEKLHRAYAGVALPNDASVRLHRKFGFREIGTYAEVGRKFGRWWDVRWFEKALPSDRTLPSERGPT